MKQKICLFLAFFLSISLYAQNTEVRGIIIDSSNNQPIPGVSIRLVGQDVYVVSGATGDFQITSTAPGQALIAFSIAGYETIEKDILIKADQVIDVGKIQMSATSSTYVSDDDGLITFDESQLDDESGTGQTIGNLSGASDDIYLSTASYAFGATRFRIRGYDSEYLKVYMNGINFNDPARGSFNYSMMGGMSSSFRNKDIISGIDISNFSFGDIGGATNISTRASEYAPGFRGSVAYTNRNYRWRVLLNYSTGVLPSGWAFSFSAITRLGNEGIVPGTFYNSIGYFLSAEKIFNPKNSLTITTFGAPTKRGQSAATFEECYQLTNDNLYNPNWGYQQGKKRNARVVESYDPAVLLSWLWKPKTGTSLNTGFAFAHTRYASSALNWYNASDPRPDYYRRLPSFYIDNPFIADQYTALWQNNENFRQIDWDHLYEVNYLNNWQNEHEGTNKSASYIVENRFSNQWNLMFNSTINHRLNDIMTLQGGIGLKYTDAHYFKTVKDLLGGEFWLDVDQFSERDYPNNPDILQNNLNRPNFHAKKGDIIGYDYHIYSLKANAWLQNNINLPNWDIYYAFSISYAQFQRDGMMRNGRAPDNSFGKGKLHIFNNAGIKAGVTYKLDGRNFFIVNALYETRAPHFGNAYISPKIKDDIIPELQNERVFSADATYRFAFSKLKGRITGFYTNFYDQTEISSFYHDQYQTFVNYIMTGVRKTFKGVEIGLAYKIHPSITLSGVATFARYQYKNRPKAITNYENGSRPDTIQTVYLRNFYVGGTPQQAFNLGVSWSAPKMWFIDVNLSWFDKAYVDLSPLRRTEAAVNFPIIGNNAQEVNRYFHEKAREITRQQELKGGFLLNMSIGKLIYLTRSKSLNINVSLSNILNKKNLQTGGYEQGRFDFTNFNVNKYPNKFYYAQGFNVFVNVGFKF